MKNFNFNFNQPWFHLTMLSLLMVIIYWPSLFHEFVWDDNYIILPIDAYFDFDLLSIFTRPANGYEYLPVRDLTLMLDAYVWGKQPFGYHLTNLILYFVSIIVLYKLTYALAEQCHENNPAIIALFTALVFLAHPIHVEAVSWVTGRNNILALLFTFTSLLLFLRNSSGNRAILALSIIMFLLALYSKASVIFYPLFVAALLIILPDLRRRNGDALIYLVIITVLTASATAHHLFTAVQLGTVQGSLLRFGSQTFDHNILKAIYLVIHYLYKLLLPSPLSTRYPEDQFDALAITDAAAAALLIMLIAVAAYQYRRHSKLPLIGLAWYLASIGPVSNLLPTVPVIADRYIYPAVFGLGLVVAVIFSRDHARKNIAYIIFALIILKLSTTSFIRTFDWRNDFTLSASVFRAYPDQSDNRTYHARTLFGYGRYDEAFNLLLNAKTPDLDSINYFKGWKYYIEGKPALALEILQPLTEKGSGSAALYLMLGGVAEALNNHDMALRYYLESIDPSRKIIDPRDTKKVLQRIAILQRGYADEIRHATTAADNNHTDLQYQANAGLLLMRLGQYEDAKRYLIRITSSDKNNWGAWHNIGICNMKLGRIDAALNAFKMAIKSNPKRTESANQMATLYQQFGENVLALSTYKQALVIEPRSDKLNFNLGKLYYLLGKPQLAKPFLIAAAEYTDSGLIRRSARKLLKTPAFE